jgi:hypothetical protein
MDTFWCDKIGLSICSLLRSRTHALLALPPPPITDPFPKIPRASPIPFQKSHALHRSLSKNPTRFSLLPLPHALLPPPRALLPPIIRNIGINSPFFELAESPCQIWEAKYLCLTDCSNSFFPKLLFYWFGICCI